MNLNEFLTGIGFFAKYPYTSFHELNLDWCITEVAKLRVEFDDFAHVNSLKYAGEWDITKSYSAFSVVDDHGFGYMALKPVAPGTQINDTEFWLMIVDYSQLIADYDARIQALETTVGDASSGLVKDVDDLQSDVGALQATVGDSSSGLVKDVTDLQTTVGDASSGLVKDVDDLQTDNAYLMPTVGDASSGLVKDVADLQNAISGLHSYWVTPEEYGAVGDGVTDDTQAVQDALNSGKNVLIENTYLITADPGVSWHHGLSVPSNTIIDGHGSIVMAGNAYTNYDVLNVYNVSNVIIRNITIVGDRDTHTGLSGEWGMGIGVGSSDTVRIENVTMKNCWGDGLYIGKLSDDPVADNKNIKVVNCTITNNRRNNVSIIHGDDILIDGCTITNANGVAPQRGIDIEPDSGMSVRGCIITNCFFKSNVAGAIGINHFTSNDVTKVIIANNTFEDQNIGGFVTGGVNQHSLPIIEGNLFHAMTSAVITSNNFAYVFTNNTAKVLVVVADPCLSMQGVSGVIRNNLIEWYTTAPYIVEESGTFNNIGENTFMGQCASHVIYAGGQYCQIVSNRIQTMTNATGLVLMDAANLIISHNDWATIHTPAFFVVAGPNFVQGTESVCFNRAAFSVSFINTGSLNKAANVENGTFVAS